jgi:hypothetical protein
MARCGCVCVSVVGLPEQWAPHFEMVASHRVAVPTRAA